MENFPQGHAALADRKICRRLAVGQEY